MNPGPPAPQASVMIQPRLRALFTGLRRNSNIINTLLKLKASGLHDGTLRSISYSLAKLDKLADLQNPEDVKLAIANMNVANSYKHNLTKAYHYYTLTNQIDWNRPKYKFSRSMPKIPTKENIMKVISHAKKYAPIFKTLMETGLMGYELSQVKHTDIDFDRGILTATGYKGHTSRSFKLTNETTAMLKTYFSKYAKFPDSKWMSKLWVQHRNTVAKKLQDPTLRTIRLYDLRHYYATTLYAKTKDILLVKQQMGHTKLETTLIYTQLIHFSEDDEYTCRTASNAAEAKDLIEHGFEYVTEIDGLKLFKKRK